MENLQYLFTAFSTVWVILFLYINHLQRRTSTLNKEVEELKEMLKRQGH